MSERPSKRSKAKSAKTFTSAPIGLRELLDASPDAIFCCDAEGRWNWLSPAIETLTGQRSSDLIGKFWTEVVSPHERLRLVRRFLRMKRRKASEPFDGAVPLTRLDGGEVLVAARVRFIERADGDPAFVGVVREARGASGSWSGPAGAGSDTGVTAGSAASGLTVDARVASDTDSFTERMEFEGVGWRAGEGHETPEAGHSDATARLRIAELEAQVAELEAQVGELGPSSAESTTSGRESAPGDGGDAALAAELERANGELERAHGELERTHAELERANGELERTHAELERANGELGRAHAELGHANGELGRAQEELEPSSAALAEAHAEIDRLREALNREASGDALAGAHDEIDRARSEASEARGLLEQMRSDAGLLRGELDEARRESMGLRAGMERARAETNDARAQLDGARNDASSARSELEQARAAATDIRAELDRVRNDASGVRSELEKARAAVADAQAALERERAEGPGPDAMAELERLRAEVGCVRAERDEAHAEAQRARAEALEATTTVERLRADFEAGTRPDDAERLSAYSKQLEERVASLEAQLGESHAEIESARREPSPAMSAGHSEATGLGEVSTEADELRAHLIEARAEIVRMRDHHTSSEIAIDRLRAELETARSARSAFEGEIARMRAAGDAIASSPLGNSQATEHVAELEQRIMALQELLETAQAKGTEWSEFISTLSHEIRTPMNGVIGMAHLLLDTGLDAQQRSWVEIIRRSAHALLALINNSLDFSRLETGKLEVEEVDYDLRVTVSEIQAVLAPVARERNLKLSCSVHHEVPSRLHGDAGRLRQVMLNVIGSAMRCSECGEVKLNVERVTESEDEVTIRCRVSGSGVGASEEQMLGLFEAFVKADASIARRHGADGLGLAVARQLVTRMRGRVGMESDASVGTTPWFEMRFQKQPEVTSAPEAPTVRLRGLRVLVVDGSGAVRHSLVEMLSAWGSRADESASAEDAIDRMRRAAADDDAYQVAIIDMELPGMNGEQLGGQIYASPELSKTRTMLLTSVGRRGDAARVQALGFSAYLIKPIQWSELYDALTEVVQAGAVAAEAPLVTRHSIAESRRNRVRIMLVDDDPVNQLVTEWTLRRHGYTTERAGTATRALEMFDTSPPDLILLDVGLPDMDGYRVAQSIRTREQQTGRHTPIMAVTGKMMAGDRARCLAAGMDDYLTKPIDLGELCGAVERWTGRLRNGAKEGASVSEQQPAPIEAETTGAQTAGDSADARGAMVVPPPAPSHVPPPAAGPKRVPTLAPMIRSSDRHPSEPLALTSEDDFAAPAPPSHPPNLALVTSETFAPDATGQSQPEAAIPLEEPAALVQQEEPVTADRGQGDAGDDAEFELQLEITPSRSAVSPSLTGSGFAAGADSSTDDDDGFVLEKAPDRGNYGGLANDPTILDMKRLDDASMGIPALREALLSTFANDLGPRLDRMDLEIMNRSSLRLEHEAHGLRGMAATIGANGCVGVFQEIERLAHEERFEGLDELMDAARREARKIEDHILLLASIKNKRAA